MNLLTIFVLISSVTGVSIAGSWCYNDNEGSGEEFYCDTGCCDSYPSETCCPVGVRVWIVVISVIGGIIFIAVLICVVCAITAYRGMSLFRVTEGPSRVRHLPEDMPNTQHVNVLYGINQSYVTAPPTYIASQPTFFTGPPTYVTTPPPYSAVEDLPSTTKI